MPELPDVTVYVEALAVRMAGHALGRVQIRGPFLLRSADPPVTAMEGATVTAVRRIGKRIAIGFDNEVWAVLHLMIAGRLHWRGGPVKLTARNQLAAFEFDNGTLLLTEAGSQHRASLTMTRGEESLRAFHAGGIEVLEASEAEFRAALQAENHTLKRAFTDPRLFSGIGNAYSDEILHRAGLSPVARTAKLTPEEIARLYDAARAVLTEWTARLRAQADGGFPEKVTAFRPEMAVHGRYGKPCPRCGAEIQRIRYASNETNYCPGCQTAGKLLADRGLSRLLGKEWPRTLEELEALKRR
jgi:formamidopyrimidine-DNA glycosylase